MHGHDELRKSVCLVGSQKAQTNYDVKLQKCQKQTIVGWCYFLMKYVQLFISSNEYLFTFARVLLTTKRSLKTHQTLKQFY